MYKDPLMQLLMKQYIYQWSLLYILYKTNYHQEADNKHKTKDDEREEQVVQREIWTPTTTDLSKPTNWSSLVRSSRNGSYNTINMHRIYHSHSKHLALRTDVPG